MSKFFNKYVLFKLLFISGLLNAQKNLTKSDIDSINNLAYEVKIQHPYQNFKLYELVLTSSIKLNYKKGQANSYSNLALMSYYQGKFDKHSFYSFKAIKLHQKLHDFPNLARDYGEYGYQIKKRNLKEAIHYMQKGLKIALANNANFELMGLYDNYGVLKELNNELDSAVFYYNKSLSLKKKHTDLNGIPYSLNNIAYVLILRGEFELAKKKLDESYKLRVESKNEIGICENLNLYGQYYEYLKNYGKAQNYFRQAIEKAHSLGYKDLEMNAYKNLYLVLEKDNKIAEAFNNQKKFLELYDSLSSVKLKMQQAELDTQFQTKEKEIEILQAKQDLSQKNIYLLGLFSALIIISLLGYLFYFRQKNKAKFLEKELDLKTSLAIIETQNQLNEQRLSISRDLHDNIGSQLTFIISSIDNLIFFINNSQPKVSNKLADISQFTRQTINELRDTIWAMNHSEISIEDLYQRISNYVALAQKSNEVIKFELIPLGESLEKFYLNSKEGIYVFRIIQEAINNAIKYSEANKIITNFSFENNHLLIVISDDGKGFDMNTENNGNGLKNMIERANSIGGLLKIATEIGFGTQIEFTLKLKNT